MGRGLAVRQLPPLLLVLLIVAAAGCGARLASAGQPAAPAAAGQTAARPAFDGEAAYKLLAKQCDFGPRPVGSDAHRKTRDWLLAQMRTHADRVEAQDFTYRGMPLTNVIGVINPDARRSVLLCAHWDTRPTADEEIDAAKRRQPILGANDGASGVAVLLELARMFRARRPDVGVVIVLLDGEDYGDFRKDEGVFLGSRHFAANHGGYKPEFGILLDMVGDRDLDIHSEWNSQKQAPGTNQKVFRIARELGYGRYFLSDLAMNIEDDHVALSRGGIPTIDLIDFNYGPWHTLDDTPDKCSAQSLAIVGSVVAEVVYRESAR